MHELARDEALAIGVVARRRDLERPCAVLAVAVRLDGALPDRHAVAVDRVTAGERPVERGLDRRLLAAEALDDDEVGDRGTGLHLLVADLRVHERLGDHLHPLERVCAVRLGALRSGGAGHGLAEDVPARLRRLGGACRVVAGAVRLPLRLPRGSPSQRIAPVERNGPKSRAVTVAWKLSSTPFSVTRSITVSPT